jgi:hypothetical protein
MERRISAALPLEHANMTMARDTLRIIASSHFRGTRPTLRRGLWVEQDRHAFPVRARGPHADPLLVALHSDFDSLGVSG